MRWPICISCRRKRSGLGDLGRPEGYVERQLQGWSRRWHAAQGGEAGRALDRRDGAGTRLARRASAAIGRGGAAAQRLPARQLSARQRRSRADRGGARLGHVHAGRSARRSRLCAQLLGRAGRPARMARNRRDADLARGVSEPGRGDRRAMPRAPASMSARSAGIRSSPRSSSRSSSSRSISASCAVRRRTSASGIITAACSGWPTRRTVSSRQGAA